MSSIQDARRKRIFLDQRALSNTTESIRQLRRAKAEAEQALLVATSELEQLERRQASLEDSLADTRAVYRRVFWSETLPLDVLCQIFTQLSNAPDELWTEFGYGRYNRERSELPFALAAVCTRWRRLALSMPSLWSYVSVPVARNLLTSAHVRRVELLLQRSESTPLDVLIFRRKLGDKDGERLASIISAIPPSRIRRFELRMQENIPRDPSLNIFKAPTPLLTHLCIIAEPPTSDSPRAWHVDPRDTYFPDIRNVQYLELQGAGMCFSPQHPPLKALHSLTIWPGISHIHFQTLLTKCAQTVRNLHLCEGNEWPAAALDALATLLPDLTSLSMDPVASEITSRLSMPNLERLSFLADDLDPDIDLFLTQVAPRITRLNLGLPSTISSAHLVVLKTLTNVRTLSFRLRAVQPYVVANDFFVHLATATPCIWPKLRSIDISGGRKLEPGDGLIQLLRARANPSSSEGSAADGPCAIEEVTLEYEGVPAWLLATVEGMLSRR